MGQSQLCRDGMMVRTGVRQHIGSEARQPSNEAAINPYGDEIRHTMRGKASANIVKARQHRRPDEIEIAHDQRPGAQDSGNGSQLASIEDLPM